MAKGCDTAAYLTDSRVDALVGKGYSFVGRYIDYLKGAHNDLTEKEVGLICNAGLEIVSLYQPKGMNSSTHYSASQGKSDVIEALELARYLRQPKNTAIYFCVDFDPLESVVRSNILPYFEAVYQAIIDKEGNPEGYRMGVYGSGLVCSSVEKNKSSVYTMLANATAWQGSSSYTQWNIKQKLPISVGGIDVDPCESSSSGTGGWRR